MLIIKKIMEYLKKRKEGKAIYVYLETGKLLAHQRSHLIYGEPSGYESLVKLFRKREEKIRDMDFTPVPFHTFEDFHSGTPLPELKKS